MLYRAFDLIIDSPITLPEAFPLTGDYTADVTITLGSVDLSVHFPDASQIPPPGTWWYKTITDQHMAFGCAAGTYEIKDSSLIIIDQYPDAPDEQVRVFLLGSALGALQIQLGRTPLHGGAIVSGGKAVIITGHQGAGKSTMTSALVHNGFPYLTDDVSSVILKNGVPYVLPAYPQRKLKRDACLSLGYDVNTLAVADKARDKFAIRDRENWVTEPAPLHMLVELFADDRTDSLSIEPVLGHDRLGMIIRSMYRFLMHLENGNLPPGEFKKILNIASNIEMYFVSIPHESSDINSNVMSLVKALDMQK